MAEFTPSKKTAQDFNNGNRYIGYDAITGTNGDEIAVDAINDLIESALYSQQQADSAVAYANGAPAVGLHHIQFVGEPTPAELWANTSWEIDTTYQGRTLIGSGDSYTFGATGGEATHTLTYAELPELYIYTGNTGSGTKNAIDANVIRNVIPNDYVDDGGQQDAGNVWGQAHNIMQPYVVINVWKRTA